jgi:hypothetical protein
MTMLELALQYAALGWYVFPCWPNTKNASHDDGCANGYRIQRREQ